MTISEQSLADTMRATMAVRRAATSGRGNALALVAQAEPDSVDERDAVAVRGIEACAQLARLSAQKGEAMLYSTLVVARDSRTAGLSHALHVGLHVAGQQQIAEAGALAVFWQQRQPHEFVLKHRAYCLPRTFASSQTQAAFAASGLHAPTTLEPAIEADGQLVPGVYRETDRHFALWVSHGHADWSDRFDVSFRISRAASMKEAAASCWADVARRNDGHVMHCINGQEVPLRVRAPSKGPNGGRIAEVTTTARDAVTGLITNLTREEIAAPRG